MPIDKTTSVEVSSESTFDDGTTIVKKTDGTFIITTSAKEIIEENTVGRQNHTYWITFFRN